MQEILDVAKRDVPRAKRGELISQLVHEAVRAGDFLTTDIQRIISSLTPWREWLFDSVTARETFEFLNALGGSSGVPSSVSSPNREPAVARSRSSQQSDYCYSAFGGLDDNLLERQLARLKVRKPSAKPRSRP